MMQIDVESKGFRRAIRFFTYGLMTMATVVLTTLVILLAMGYRFDRNQFGVIREGLLQLGSHPVDTHYKLNGKTYKNLTPDKQTLPAGSYSLELSQTGYRPWQKQIDIIAGHIHWVNYPRLFPVDLETKTVKDFVNVSFSEVSPDKRWILVNPGGEDKDKLEIIDTKDPAKPVSTTLTIPDAVLTKKDGKIGQLEFNEWALDSKQFTIKHVNGDVSEYIRLDRTQPEKAVNLNSKFQLDVDELHFSGGNANIMYARTEGVLRRFDVGSNTASGALMNGVRQFEVFGDATIAYQRTKATKDGSAPSSQEVGVRIKDRDIVLKELPASDDLLVKYGEFDRHAYLVLANRTKQTTSIYQDITEAANRQATFAEFSGLAAQFAQFSSNTRFLALQDGTHFGVYDFYEQQKFGFTVEGLSDKGPARWLDTFHLAGVKAGVLHVMDFDGTNQQILVAAQPELDPLLDEDDDILYTFTKAQDGSSTSRPFNLTSTSVKAEAK